MSKTLVEAVDEFREARDEFVRVTKEIFVSDFNFVVSKIRRVVDHVRKKGC